MAMYLVTQSKYGRVNQLGYSPKTGEYVYFHRGVEQWREKGDESLLNYFNYLRSSYEVMDEEAMMEMSTFPIWERYCKSCSELDRKDMGF